MLSPLISRMVQVPIELFSYLAFQIPLTIFIVSYSILILINARENALKIYCRKWLRIGSIEDISQVLDAKLLTQVNLRKM